MMQLALEIVARTLFNTEVTSDVLAINHEVNVIMDLYHYLVSLPMAEAYLFAPLPGLTRFRRARARLDAVVHRIITEHRSRPASADSGDLLTMLMGTRDEEDSGTMTDEQLRDEIITIFLADLDVAAARAESHTSEAVLR
jgi:cytochrome P450